MKRREEYKKCWAGDRKVSLRALTKDLNVVPTTTSSSQVPVTTVPRDPISSTSLCHQSTQVACTHTDTQTHTYTFMKTIKIRILERIEEIYVCPPSCSKCYSRHLCLNWAYVFKLRNEWHMLRTTRRYTVFWLKAPV